MSQPPFGYKETTDPKEMACQIAYLFGLAIGQQARIEALEERIAALEDGREACLK